MIMMVMMMVMMMNMRVMMTVMMMITCTRSLASVQSAGGGHWKHWTLWIVLCTETRSRNTGSSRIVAKEVRPAPFCRLEEDSKEVVTLPKHRPISSTSTTAFSEKVGLTMTRLIKRSVGPQIPQHRLAIGSQPTAPLLLLTIGIDNLSSKWFAKG